MRIYTRQGDKGMTRLADGIQLAKDHLRVETYGYIDELNSHIGLLICDVPSQEIGLLADLQLLQQELFDLGGELAFSSAAQNESIWQVNAAWTTRLEQQIDRYSEPLPPLRQFILPGGFPRSGAGSCGAYPGASLRAIAADIESGGAGQPRDPALSEPDE